MPEDYSLEGMPVWCTLLMHEKKSIVVPFYTVQESVEESSFSFCEHCRLVGMFSCSLPSMGLFVYVWDSCSLFRFPSWVCCDLHWVG